MDYTDFVVDRAQHMRPLEYDLSESHNVLVRYLHDMGVLDNVPAGTLGPAEILTASDALAAPLRSLVVGGNSVVNPLLTVCGFNQWDEQWEVGGIRQTNGALIDDSERIRSKNYIPVIGGQTYYIKGAYGVMACYDVNKDYIGNVPYRNATVSGQYYLDMPESACYIRFSMLASYGTTYNNDICINFSDPVRNGTYEPYQGNTVTLPVTLRSVADDVRDTAKYTYLRPSTREGWAWYSAELTRMTLATHTTEQLPAIELPYNVGPICTIFAVSDATPQLTAQYIQNLNASIANMHTAIADIISG